jgi:hypothetical protein
MNKKSIILIAITLMFAKQLSIAGDMPEVQLTSGAINPAVTQQNIHSTVCIRGYTKTVRPPTHYTNKLKKTQIIQYGYADTNPKHYEEDHLIPLSIGGSPSDPQNLWPQPRLSEWNAQKKDVLEFRIYKLVCDGLVPLDEARAAMALNWIDAYKHYLVGQTI